MKQSSLEADNERLRTELATVRHDFTSLGSDRSEQEREMSQIRMKLAVTEQDAKMKDEQLMHAADELSFERDAKVSAEYHLDKLMMMTMMCRFVERVLNSPQTRCRSQSNSWDLRSRAKLSI